MATRAITVAAFLVQATRTTGDIDSVSPPVQGAALPGHLLSANNAHNVQELQEWRSYQLKQVENVPSMFRSIPAESIQKEYANHLTQLTGNSSFDSSVADIELGGQDPSQTLELIADPSEAGNGMEVDNGMDCAAVVAPRKIQDTSVNVPLLFTTAAMCREKQDLDAWLGCQLTEVEKHVPTSHRDFAAKHVFKQFSNRVDELIGNSRGHVHLSDSETLPVFLAVGENCDNEDELAAWRKFQQGQIDSRVPPKYHDFASGALQGAFQQRLVELRTAGGGIGSGVAASLAVSAAAPASTAAATAATAAAASVSSSSLLLLVTVGLSMPALFSFAASVMRSSSKSTTWTALNGGYRPIEERGQFAELC